MINFLVQLLKTTFLSYKIQDPVLQLELWQYMTLLILLLISLFLTWLTLYILRKTLAMQVSSLKSLTKFERYTYPLTSLGTLLYAHALLEIPAIPIWVNIRFGLNILFAGVALITVNRLMGRSFCDVKP